MIVKKYIRFISIIVLLIYSINSFAFIPFLLGLFGASAETAAAGTSAAAAASFDVYLTETATSSALTMTEAFKSSSMAHAALLAIGIGAYATQKPKDLLPFQIVLDPNTPLKTPDGWTPPVDNHSQPTPPQTTTPKTVFVTPEDSQQFSDWSAACTNVYHLTFGQNATTSLSNDSSSQICFAHGISIAPQIHIQIACPIGYGLQGSSCNTINSSQVMKPSDNQCEFIKNGLSMSPDSQDPDCLNANMLANGIVQNSPSEITITSPDKSTSAKITTSSDGSTHVERVYADTAGGKTTHEKIDIAPDGTMQGHVKTEAQGTGSLEIPSSTSSPLNSTINFDKSGLATESGQSVTNNKLQNIKEGQCGGLNQPACKIDPEGETDDTSDIESQKNEADSAWNAQFSKLSDFSGAPNPTKISIGIPDTPQGCIALQPVFLSHTINFDLCPYQDVIKRILGWALYMLTAGIVFNIFLRRPEFR